MNITIIRDRTISVAAIDGDITHSVAPELQRQLLDALAEASVLILDFSQLRMLTSAGLRALLLLHRNAAAADRRLILAAAPAGVRDVMEVTGFWDQFDHFPSLTEARAAGEGGRS